MKIQHIQLFKDNLVVHERENGLPKITIYGLPPIGQAIVSLQGGRVVDFVDPIYSVDPEESQFPSNILRFSYSSMRTPPSVYDYDMDTGESVLKKIEAVCHLLDLMCSFLKDCFGHVMLLNCWKKGEQNVMHVAVKHAFFSSNLSVLFFILFCFLYLDVLVHLQFFCMGILYCLDDVDGFACSCLIEQLNGFWISLGEHSETRRNSQSPRISLWIWNFQIRTMDLRISDDVNIRIW